MADLLNVILPVFIVVGFGYLAAWREWITELAVDGLMIFAQNFAIPCLLFAAISKIDLSGFNFPLLFSYYAGAFGVFALAFGGARFIFGRSLQDCISVGFCTMYPNSLMLGLVITERAYGPNALAANYAIIAVHAPILYSFGVMFMETARASDAKESSTNGIGTIRRIAISLAKNPIVIGIFLGFVVNIGGISMPGTLTDAVDLMARAALPVALFGVGGVLVRYKPAGDMKVIFWITTLSLIVHPAITYSLGKWGFQLDQAQMRSAVLTAAMAPGINTFLFANIYGAAKRVVASSVLIATAVSILSISVWLIILP